MTHFKIILFLKQNSVAKQEFSNRLRFCLIFCLNLCSYWCISVGNVECVSDLVVAVGWSVATTRCSGDHHFDCADLNFAVLN